MDAEDVAQEHRDVVLHGVREVADADPVDVVPDEPAEVPAADAEHDGGQEVVAEQPPPERPLLHGVGTVSVIRPSIADRGSTWSE